MIKEWEKFLRCFSKPSIIYITKLILLFYLTFLLYEIKVLLKHHLKIKNKIDLNKKNGIVKYVIKWFLFILMLKMYSFRY